MTGFRHRVAFVTGGTRGIGRAIVRDLVRRGALVAFTYVHHGDLAEALEEETARAGHRATGLRVDGAEFEAVKAAVGAVRERLGPIDFLVNNAGMTRDKLLMAMSPEDWRTVMAVNLDSVFNVTRAVVTGMMKARRGAIVNVTSVSGVIGMAGQCNYSASKAGIIGFTKALAREVARLGVRVNALALGFVTTDMTAGFSEKLRAGALATIPSGRFGTPEEAAGAAAFLLSDDAAYITGHVLHVDGGLAA
jgi:3-oxoacyl-[acyl-carrier protein] reductase